MSVPVPSSTALIVGCGYVGLRVARLWTRLGIRTFAITRSEEKAMTLRTSGVEPIVADLSVSAGLPEIPDTDVVLWSVGFDRTSHVSREAAWIDGLSRLLTALPTRVASRRLLYTSSTSVYGDRGGREVDEATEPNPDSESGQICVAAEELLRQFERQSGTIVTVLRLAGIYGPQRLLRRVNELRDGFPLATEPDEWLNLIHVDDVVSAIETLRCCESPPALINLVAAGSVTRRTYYFTLSRLANAPPPVFQNPGATLSTAGRRGGNRRVTSRVRPALPITFQFDDCETGLKHAIEQSDGI